MPCSQCKHENAPGAKFCLECGERLPPGAKFCLECGASLTAAVTRMRPHEMRRYETRAVALDPGFAAAWGLLSFTHSWDVNFGLTDAPERSVASALEAARRAAALDPREPFAHAALANAYLAAGDVRNGFDAARRLVAAQPEHWWGQMYLALNAVSLGRPDEARAAIAEARRLKPDLSIETIQRSFGVSRPEADARRNAALRQAALE